MSPSLPRRTDARQYRRMPKSATLPLSPVQAVGCCPPLARQPLSGAEAEQVAPLLKALAEPVRLRLVSLIATREGGEACVCDLNEEFDLSQPTISHHLRVLYDAGLVCREQRGTWVYYGISAAVLDAVARLLRTTA